MYVINILNLYNILDYFINYVEILHHVVYITSQKYIYVYTFF